MTHKILNSIILYSEILPLFKLKASMLFKRTRNLLHEEARRTSFRQLNHVNRIIINANKFSDSINFFCLQFSFKYNIDRVLSPAKNLRSNLYAKGLYNHK